ncbi:uncharacterized protein LOC118647500 [Monomorium pharaonis]|uniref:uncharacterized protein LOC118647500 n=1 Tax=Monomorium pharaonis TaxID=307658 RepID=UPI001746301F|nr:uncharacterized protein LOC118647500 [Monomorium pharaonis]
MNIGQHLSSLQCTSQQDLEQMAKVQCNSVLSDNCNLISVTLRNKITPHYDSLSKNSIAFEKNITPSKNSSLFLKDQRSVSRCFMSSSDSRISLKKSGTLYDCDNSIFFQHKEIAQIRMILNRARYRIQRIHVMKTKITIFYER